MKEKKQPMVEPERLTVMGPFGKQQTSCPICSGQLGVKGLAFSDGSVSPEQVRCLNESCPAHRDPEQIKTHVDRVNAAHELAAKKQQESEQK